MKPPDNEIGPWDFSPGTPAWTAAMLELQEKRKSSEVHVHFRDGGKDCPCARCSRSVSHGPNDITVQIIHVGGDAPCPNEKESPEPREAVTPISDVSPPPQQERRGADANSEPDEQLAEKAREGRWNAYIQARKRRPSVHKPSYRGHQWPPSAYGL
jgi:hypothetical protein